MKRIILIFISLVFTGYLLVLVSAYNLLGINKYKTFKTKVFYGIKLSGLGGLFTRKSTLINYQTLYQFYQNNNWGEKHFFEQETFNRYIDKGNFTELKHVHLDARLAKELYFNVYLRKKDLTKSQEYKTLISHLILGHNNNQVPDSIRLVFQKKQEGNVIKLLSLTYEL